jgi:threonine dehydratase
VRREPGRVRETLETHGRGHIEELLGGLGQKGWQVAEER